ncbi:MAG: hypothetical protein L0228_18230 [Planctomycetes bacterium]|nr:hypothetical protein [Planctomycetota bacterium]
MEVLLSLVRRGEFDNHPYLAAGLQAWQIYNANIKTFCDQYPDRCLLAHIDGLIAHVEQFAHLLQHKLQMDLRLNSDSFDQIYHANELQKTPLLPEVTDVLAKLFPGLLELYHCLNAQADLPADTSRPNSAASPPLSTLARFTAALREPITLPVKHSLLQLLVSLLAPEPTETMLSRFKQNIKGAQRTIDYFWLQVQRFQQLNAEQSQELDRQSGQIESLMSELDSIHNTRIWKVLQSCRNLKERWKKAA